MKEKVDLTKFQVNLLRVTTPIMESRWPDEVEQRGDSPVLVMHDGVTKSTFAHVIPAKGFHFPSCEKVEKMIIIDLDTLGYHRVVFRCDTEPSILALLRAVKLAWTGDMVQETSAVTHNPTVLQKVP